MTESEKRLSSPEQLNEYIRVATPGAWVLLSAAALFFAGMFVWLFTGELEVTIPISAYKEGGHTVAFVSAEDAWRIAPGMSVRVWGGFGRGEGIVTSVATDSIPFNTLLKTVGEANVVRMGLDGSHRLFQVTMNTPDTNGAQAGSRGVVQGTIIIRLVHPADFLLSASS